MLQHEQTCSVVAVPSSESAHRMSVEAFLRAAVLFPPPAQQNAARHTQFFKHATPHVS
jgi:hypothetical protein